MTVPLPGQTVHSMTWRDALRVRRDMRRQEGRNVAELALYTTDALRDLYRKEDDDLICLRDGIVSRVQLVAVIRWRTFWAQAGYTALLGLSFIAGRASVVAALEGWPHAR